MLFCRPDSQDASSGSSLSVAGGSRQRRRRRRKVYKNPRWLFKLVYVPFKERRTFMAANVNADRLLISTSWTPIDTHCSPTNQNLFHAYPVAFLHSYWLALCSFQWWREYSSRCDSIPASVTRSTVQIVAAVQRKRGSVNAWNVNVKNFKGHSIEIKGQFKDF
jgi:hypothetical protein